MLDLAKCMKNIRKINGFEGSGHPKWCHWEVKGPKVMPLGLQRTSLRGRKGPVERSLAAKVALLVGLVCKTYANGPDPTATRTRLEVKVYLSDKTCD